MNEDYTKGYADGRDAVIAEFEKVLKEMEERDCILWTYTAIKEKIQELKLK